MTARLLHSVYGRDAQMKTRWRGLFYTTNRNDTAWAIEPLVQGGTTSHLFGLAFHMNAAMGATSLRSINSIIQEAPQLSARRGVLRLRKALASIWRMRSHHRELLADLLRSETSNPTNSDA